MLGYIIYLSGERYLTWGYFYPPVKIHSKGGWKYPSIYNLLYSNNAFDYYNLEGINQVNFKMINHHIGKSCRQYNICLYYILLLLLTI